MRARANVNYFSSIETSQQFNTNIYDASRNMRSFGGNLVGAWASTPSMPRSITASTSTI